MKTSRIITMALVHCAALYADNVLRPGTPKLDRPTLTALGVQLPITGDDNFNSTVTLQYRPAGTLTWQNGLPLFRVHPETVAGYTVGPQFGGSIFDLKPATTYEIQLHAVDPDGVDQTFSLSATTRAVPRDPITPRVRNVTDLASFRSALSTAAAGDVITLANGVYAGNSFGIFQAGTPENPIVIRGASEDGVILDGGNCTGCNIFEFYGAGYVHLERMTLQNGERAIRLQQDGGTGNVIRRVHIKNTNLGIGGRSNQNDTYIADNILEGRLVWPHIDSDDNNLYGFWDGISVFGFGAVVAHNQIIGYSDAMKTEQRGARANDFYGNDIMSAYDNGIELDDSEGNTRCFRNRFMNTFNPISVQPIHGGPSYVFRNVSVNFPSEQLKFHALAGTPYEDPSGVLVYNNTFVSAPNLALSLQTDATSHYFEIENNLFIAPPTTGPEVVDWTGPIDNGTFDYNGYFPDGVFRFNTPSLGGYLYEANLAALKTTSMETHGLIARGALFASGLVPPATYKNLLPGADATLAFGSIAVDQGRILPNINDNFQGAGPDLGALEQGCPSPTYGPRPEGIDESNEVFGCASSSTGSTSVSVAPATVKLARSQVQQFTATTLPAGSAVTWKISPTRGSISSTGLFTAPSDALLGESVTVTAVSAANSTVVGNATVQLTAPVSITLSPGPLTLSGGQTQQFTALVSGAADPSTRWILNPAAGSITIGGLFTAPTATSATQSITVTAVSSADSTKTASSVVTVNAIAPTGSGLLQGSTSALSSASLTTEGTVDWVHWGDSALSRKATATPVLGDVTPIAFGYGVQKYNNDPRSLNWTDGSSTASSTANRNGIYINGGGNGFSFAVPATATAQVLRIHVGGYFSSARLVATLSDNSAPAYTDLVPSTGGQYDRDYVLNFRASAAGQTLTVQWTNAGGGGNVTWNAASLDAQGITPLLQATSGTASSVALTTEGTLDWAHWGDGALSRKSLATSVFGNIVPVTTGNSVYSYANDPRIMNWSDGAPLASSSGNRNGIFIAGVGNGFSFTVPANTTTQVLRIHVGGWISSARLVATLSDGSVAPYTEEVAYYGASYDRDYVISFRSVSAGQTINVKWTMTGGGGNVTWNAASLGIN